MRISVTSGQAECAGTRTLDPVPSDATRPETTLVRRARKVNRVLAETYPDAGCELDFRTPFELLIATVLSAQTTDRRVNAITPALFAAFPDARAMAAADRAVLEELIRPTGFFRAKTESLQGLRIALKCTRKCAAHRESRLEIGTRTA